MSRREAHFSVAAEREAAESELVFISTAGIWNSPQDTEQTQPDIALFESLNLIPGTMKQRTGYSIFTSAYSASTPGIRGIHSYQRPSVSPVLVYAYNGGVYTGTTKASVETGLTNNPFEFVTFADDKLYYVNGDNGLHVWTGTGSGTTVSAYTPSASEPANYLADSSNAIQDSKYIEVHEGVMYMGGPASAPYRLYRCDEVRGADYWHHQADVKSARNGAMTRLKSHSGKLFIFKEDSIHYADGLIGDSSFQLRLVHPTIGCLAGRTVQELPGLGLMFLGSDMAFYLLRPELIGDKNATLVQMSSHISNLMQYVTRSLAVSAVTGAAAGVTGKLYMCRVTRVGTVPLVLVCDYTKAVSGQNDVNSLFVPWSIYQSGTGREFDPNCFTTHYTGTAELFVAGASGTQNIYTLDGGGAADDGITMTARLTTKALDFGEPHYHKQVSEIRVKYTYGGAVAPASVLEPYVSVDDGSYETLDTVNMYQASPTFESNAMGATVYKVFEATIPVNKMGNRFRFKFENDTSNTTLELLEIRIRYTIVHLE